MKIKINLYATLSQYLPNRSGQTSANMDIKNDTSVRELLQQLDIPDESVKLIFINGVHAGMDAILKDGDRLGVFPPIGGG